MTDLELIFTLLGEASTTKKSLKFTAHLILDLLTNSLPLT